MNPTDNERVTRNGYTNFPNALFDNGLAGRIGTSAFAVYLHLITWKGNDSDVSYPSQGRIAKELGVCEKTVINAIAKLLEHNLIEIIEKGVGRGNNNKYRLVGLDVKGVKCAPFTAEKVKDFPVKGVNCSEEKVQDLHPTSTIVQVPCTNTTTPNDCSGNGIDNGIGNGIQNSIPSNETPSKKPLSKKTTYSQDFLTFWDAYPRKVGKGEAWKEYQKVKAELPPIDELVSIVERHARTDQWTKDGGQFIPHPCRWFKQRRWEDELDSKPRVVKPRYTRDY